MRTLMHAAACLARSSAVGIDLDLSVRRWGQS